MTPCDTLGCFNTIEDGEEEYCDDCSLLLCDDCWIEHLCWDGKTEEG